MKLIEDTPTRLAFTLGIPWFNGTRALFDKATGLATIETKNLFWPSKLPAFPLAEIEGVDLVSISGPTQVGKPTYTAAHPQLRLADGTEIALPSSGRESGERAVAKLRGFLGG